MGSLAQGGRGTDDKANDNGGYGSNRQTKGPRHHRLCDGGDVIITGTPGGVGHARKPPRYLRAGQLLRTSIDGLGELRNTTVAG